MPIREVVTNADGTRTSRYLPGYEPKPQEVKSSHKENIMSSKTKTPSKQIKPAASTEKTDGDGRKAVRDALRTKKVAKPKAEPKSPYTVTCGYLDGKEYIHTKMNVEKKADALSQARKFDDQYGDDWREIIIVQRPQKKAKAK